jgi:hypothetical protein
MARIRLSLRELDSTQDGNQPNPEALIAYSVIGLEPGIDVTIYQLMGTWFISGAGCYWQGKHESPIDALFYISQHFAARKKQSDQ